MLKRINFTNKKGKFNPEMRNASNTIDERKLKSKVMTDIIMKDRLIIYLDESAIDETLVPLRGYAEAGKPFVVNMKPKKERVSLLAAITKERVLGYQVFQGSVKAEDYGSFILELLSSNEQLLYNLKNCVFYMDNARIHKAKVLKPLLSRLTVFYAAPYSPFLNPIEEWFGVVKHRMRKLGFRSRWELLHNLHQILHGIERRIYSSAYRHTIKFMIQSINKEKID